MGKESVSERLARIIENDAEGEIKRTMRVVQSDVMSLLSEFMSVSKFDMSVEKADEGYMLKIEATVEKFYGVGNTTECEGS